MRRTPPALALALAGTLAVCGGARAQVALGLRGGVNLSDVTSNQFGFGGVGHRTAPVGGAFLSIAGPASIGFQTEILYAQKGFSALVEGGTATANIAYIDVPILVKVRLVGQQHRIRPSLFGGWFLGFEISCSLGGALEGIGGEGDCDALLRRRGKLDGGFVFGAGAEVGLVDRTFLVFDGRYGAGQLNLNWQEADDRVLSQVWSFTAGAGILLGF